MAKKHLESRHDVVPNLPDGQIRLGASVPGIDVERFAAWARVALPDLGPLQQASLLSGGHSNLNILLNFGAHTLVLRRPPLGHIMASAHNMEREYRALTALSGTSVPAPRALHFHGAEGEVTGVDAPFLLMEFVAASALGSAADNAGRSAAQLGEASVDLARVLANLHDLDPRAIGLEGFGRAAGYLERQLTRWAEQLEASRSRETPLLDQLIKAIPSPPEHATASLVHGDFKINNALIVFTPESARIGAVLDWEMATIGDPFADLGMFGTYWEMASTHPAIAAGFETPVDFDAGYPDFSTLLEVYASHSSQTLPDMRWYRAFAAMKIGVITESLHYRHHIGAARGSGFELMAAMTEPIAQIGLEALAEPS